jgi:hypothetical protein
MYKRGKSVKRNVPIMQFMNALLSSHSEDKRAYDFVFKVYMKEKATFSD